MSFLYPKAYFKDRIIPVENANLSIASSAVLYGLSVYTVLPVHIGNNKEAIAFRIHDHYQRLINSSRIIGIDTFEPEWDESKFVKALQEVILANSVKEDVFVRVSVHVSELLPGTRSRGMETTVSMFIYKAESILPLDGARLKTSVWRRIPDYCIPSRAKVNGAYINSVLAKQDAIDSGYDDCIFLDSFGHVCELSAANIFIVRDGVLITPNESSDLLEGINRNTVLMVAKELGIKIQSREIDLTELYVADEVFACGTSTYVAPIIEVDARKISNGKVGPLTVQINEKYMKILKGQDNSCGQLTTIIKT